MPDTLATAPTPKAGIQGVGLLPRTRVSLSKASVASPCFLSPPDTHTHHGCPHTQLGPALIELKVRTMGFPLQTSSRSSPTISAHFISSYCVSDPQGAVLASFPTPEQADYANIELLRKHSQQVLADLGKGTPISWP